jgi:hypothetical protein
MKRSATKRPGSKTSRGRRAGKPDTDTANKATTAEFEREDMGIAPKE